MIAKLRRLMPDSLTKRITLTISASVLLLFLVNIGVVCIIQIRFLGLLEKERSDTIASFYVLLSDMDQQHRMDALGRIANFSRSTESSLSLHLIHDTPVWTETRPRQIEQSEQAVSALKNILIENKVSPLPEIRARIFKHNDDYTVDSWARQITTHAPRGNLILQMAVRLDADTWLNVTQPLYLSYVWLIWMQRLVFLVEFVIFGVLVVFLLRRLLKPLQVLTDAAERVGKQPEVASPLPECGCREIREAAQSFNRMQARIQENLDERNRMLAAMAHDLRTPLTRVQLRIEDVEPEELREKLTEGLKEVRSIAEQSLELSGSLKISEKNAPLDIGAFMQSRVDDFAEMGHAVSMSDTPEDAPLVAMARPLCLKRCVDNLLRNAVAYAGGAKVTIGASEKDVTIDILDNGPGIPDAYLEKIFEPYLRLETSRNRETGGTGLGLSIARNMAMLNNGTLTLENRPEGGLRARIVLPKLERF